MPAPGNDNFANAFSLQGVSGQASSSNVDATSQAGEPANNGRTVWYVWTPPPGAGIEYFATLYNATVGALASPFQSIIQIFGGPSVNALTEAAYYLGSFTEEFAGWESGGKVAIQYDTSIQAITRASGIARVTLRADCGLINGMTVTVSGVQDGSFNVNNAALTSLTSIGAGEVLATYVCPGPDTSSSGGDMAGNYYVRIDGRPTPGGLPGGPGQEGNFWISWGPFVWFQLGNCAGCAPTFFTDEDCAAGTIEMLTSFYLLTLAQGNFCLQTCGGSGAQANVSDQTLTLPAGVFRVRYCHGVAYSSSSSTPSFIPISVLYVIAPSGTFSNWTGADPNAPGDGYVSVAACEAANRCLKMTVQSAGGTWQLGWSDYEAFPPNPCPGCNVTLNGRPCTNWNFGVPVFGFYQVQPLLSLNASVTNSAWVTGGASAICHFAVNNNNDVDWNDVTVTLTTSGGISGATPVSPITLPANSTTGFNILFNCTTPNVTATLQLSSPYFPATITLPPIFLGPIIAPIYVPRYNGRSTCTGNTQRHLSGFNWEFINTGYWNTQTVFTATVASSPNGVFISDPGPGNCPFLTSSSEAIGMNSESGLADFGFTLGSGNGSASAATVQVVAVDNGTTLGTWTSQITVPA